MSTLKISRHSDVPAALDLVKEEVDKESQRIYTAGGDALKAGHVKPAKEAIAYAAKLKDFVKKIQKLGEEWTALEAKIDSAAPEVKEIVHPMLPRNRRKGFTRKVDAVGPKTNFTVTFPDGEVISASKACWSLAKSVEKLNPVKVAALGLIVCGEPLVTQDKTLHKKYPYATIEIADGWFVATHCSTATKIGYVKKIAKAFKINVRIKTVPGSH